MKHLLKLSDLGKKEIYSILNTADQMKFNLMHRLEKKPLAGKSLAMIFSEPSMYTRVSFETGMFQLGGQALYLSTDAAGLGRDEPVEDTALALSRYVDGIMIYGHTQRDVEKLAGYSSVPVINGMTDYAHPCQVLADLMTIRERFSALKGLRICFVGAVTSVCNSLIMSALTCGMNISVATPTGHEPYPDILNRAGGIVRLTQNPFEAAEGADVVYTDSRHGMSDNGKAANEDECPGFQVNSELMAAASPEAMLLHPLPARRGVGITAEVFESHSKEIFDQTENRLHAQKALLALLMGSDEE